ncbi:ATP-binding protein [Brevibacillus laterosporus]|uniref:histidine kinase n=2 Tax=Brevibacillus TaxID=55080 RepID=A0A0F7EH21_BRELA|nr:MULTISPECIES: PAS domain-containing sensor histidine kinase [Brevibacillus]AKF93667.1 diguanylate cyclase [Brevibacillus laterosporus]MCR8987399.1 ATP-binding protein [Brevibacillus laterosporus]MCR8997073.1 ATP-binding protein [Brevibacillus laterosporus]MCZ0833137.1 ATP-binding protein [Brevibacillus halotolerans]GIO03343.1 hypothetical protein J5TS2_40110 [Brevibacillus halotolerans]
MEKIITSQKCHAFSRLKQYSQHIKHALLIVDGQGLILEVSEALLQATGFSYEQIIAAPFQKVVPYMNSVRHLYDSLLEKEKQSLKPTEMIYQDVQGKKSKTPVMITISYKNGEPIYFLHFFQLTKDLSISLSQRMANQLTSEINLGVVVLDVQARLVDISQVACKILGVDRVLVLNQHIDQVFAGIPEEQRLVQRELLEGVKFQNKAMSWTNQKQRYELLVDSNTLHNEVGQIVGAYVIFKDVTNMRSLEQKIERSDRLAMIGQIAAGTAHEIRNPLTSIKGFLQMFQQSFKENGMDKEKTFTDIMLTELHRINSLVSEFLLLSKPRDVQYQMISLHTVFEEIMPIVENEALLHGIEVRYTGTEALPMVVGDAELLKQVFLNICKNGMEAMGNEGTLTVSYHYEEDCNKISLNIQDTGPGIPGYLIDKIFDPFFTTKDEGTGLGLSVCQKIIHDIGGQIRVSSKGFGTTFHILLSYI